MASAVFSYTQADAALARDGLDPILTATGRDQRLELSRRILDSAENFIVAPSFVDGWDDETRETVKKTFLESTFNVKPSKLDDTPLLFSEFH